MNVNQPQENRNSLDTFVDEQGDIWHIRSPNGEVRDTLISKMFMSVFDNYIIKNNLTHLRGDEWIKEAKKVFHVYATRI